ncbi:uncharacterized protein [Physcomitrium patens]|uniref:non-specific serine/threonine protein kinase n=1 Tax=Physcomitrium patens TaxID=3218 RepID=A9TGA9_PHYPA|nr:EKC/KEOPS complex subunit bud32-like [Physcomitrium patens]XP_024397007.1 EKC/KEOPS complex subunit bud32-like [Physcomitrium patens]XP_024397008.1 EKC/KEOPS complex subunit bud32-like [Physcomitrium patens]XP_024397009.1 EKC/KEOPS complex subunit bud32-like [Physcomitrium patens]PNR39706.1 hypothetical protein PHYPA_019985 [Physcomitrium patens]|eukprot:XP_024397006.1 EKC/KEOPS complex subunit bud32-like [Physcomitrella patens]
MADGDNNESPQSHHDLPLYKQGAEARVYESTFLGKRAIVKERFSKKYRHPVLDVKLTQKRLTGEARTLTKARKLGVVTPALYAVNLMTNSLTFEFVEGPLVKDILLRSGPLPTSDDKIEELAGHIGRAIAKLHDGGLIHGDLTTSNMIVCAKTNRLVLIDFGLGYNSTLPEDKAVDLYVLERACVAMHSSVGDFNGLILAAYNKASKYWSSTYNKLAAVRLRGRKRVMVG